MKHFLSRKTSWSTAELGLIKLCLAAAWVSAGAYFHEYFQDYIFPLLGVFVTTAIWLWYLWVKKLKHKKNTAYVRIQ